MSSQKIQASADKSCSAEKFAEKSLTDAFTADNPGDMPEHLAAFRAKVLERGQELWRDLPWRHTRDPYAIWISEVMLQQTQVARVDGRWQRWLRRFPNIAVLADADAADVLEEWQGLGYNRRALSLHKAAQILDKNGGVMPQDEHELVALPGIGPATAAGIRAFAQNLPGVYLETNVRTVFLHELFPDAEGVPDSALTPLVAATCPQDNTDPHDDPRTWYYALLDYGAYLKQTIPNPSRRSRTHTKQSKFEGSHRQKRAEVLRILLAARSELLSFDDLASALDEQEVSAGRAPVAPSELQEVLSELTREGFCTKEGEKWHA